MNYLLQLTISAALPTAEPTPFMKSVFWFKRMSAYEHKDYQIVSETWRRDSGDPYI